MSDVDFTRLTDAERAEYERLGDMNNLSAREQLAEHAVTLLVTVLWLLVCLVLFVPLAQGQQSQGMTAALLVVVVGGLVGVCWTAARVGRESIRTRRAAYLKQIGYETRSAKSAPAASAYEDRPMTKRQMQAAWYPDRPNGLNWRDRELGEILGMDGDTYESNFRD